MLMTTGEVKAQAADEEPGKNVVVDGLAYTLDKTAKTAAVIPNSYYDDNKEVHLLCAPMWVTSPYQKQSQWKAWTTP